MPTMLSRKQTELLNLRDLPNRRIFVDGTVRSGKSVGVSLGIVAKICSPDIDWEALGIDGFACYAPTLQQAKDVQAGNLEKACRLTGTEFRPYRSNTHACQVDGWDVFLIPLSDLNAYKNWDGYTFGSVWGDEIISCDEESVRMLDMRASLDESQIVYTTNPHSQHHWAHDRYIDNAKRNDVFRQWMTFVDNPAMWDNIAYVQDLIRSNTGAMLQRRVFGQWVAAEGLVYPHYEQVLVDGRPENTAVIGYDLWSDHGTMNATTVLKAEYLSDGRVYLAGEWGYSGREDGARENNDMAEEVYGLWPDARQVVYDSAAAGWAASLESVGYYVAPAQKDMDIGIQAVNARIQHRELLIDRKCRELLSDLSLYEWDERKARVGIEVPSQRTRHDWVDALRYGAMSMTSGRRLG